MKIIIYAIISLVLFVAYVRYLEATSIFIPSRHMPVTPSDVGIEYEDVSFPSGPFTLNGWFIPARGAKYTFVFSHGNAGNISGRLDRLAFLRSVGVNVFVYDYRGYGKSTGNPNEKGMYEDARAAYDYLRQRDDVDARGIVSYGVSLGGAAAVDLAASRTVAALIVDSSFSSAQDMAKRLYPFVPSFLLRVKMDSVSKIKDLNIPKFIIHSTTDETVPFEFGKKLYDEAAEPKQFLKIEGSHEEGYLASRAEYTQAIRTFLDKI